MKDTLKISRDGFKKWIDSLVENNFTVYAPKGDAGETYFKPITSWDEADIQTLKTKRGVKELFFPIAEELIQYKRNGFDIEIEDTIIDDKPFIVAGLRPCDFQGLNIIDKLFSWDYEDNFYLKRRRNGILIVFICPSIEKSCFCTSIIGDYPQIEGADICVTEINKNGYLVDVLTAKGEDTINKDLFKKATEKDKKEAKKKAKEIAESLTKIDVSEVKDWLEGHFEDGYWKECSLECLSCGICTFVCPTCHCFDIIEDRNKDCHKRIRSWDSCSFSDFTRMKVHQPRPEPYRRWRQRIMHKYLYYVKNFDMIACVGCGRCINQCPVGMNIIDMLTEINGKGKTMVNKGV